MQKLRVIERPDGQKILQEKTAQFVMKGAFEKEYIYKDIGFITNKECHACK